MRIMGAVLLAFGAGLLGRYWVSRLRAREEYLAGVLRLISRIQTELEYSSPPIDNLLESLYTAENTFEFLADCRASLRKNLPFPKAWEIAVRGKTSALSKKDRENLIAFGHGIGTTDIAGQSRQCGLYVRIFTAAHSDAVQERQKHAAYIPRLTFLLGICGGLLIL
ncbi:MAG: stage III sporulation protein AB [Oscillospiraceae bacterium]|nr:stage III sporulation protein AB [Oscillospiraceae bacterium]